MSYPPYPDNKLLKEEFAKIRNNPDFQKSVTRARKELEQGYHEDKIMEFLLNDIIIVKAWWNKDLPIKCSIISLNGKTQYGDGPFLTVKPIEGNPHARSIHIDRVIRKE